MTGSLWNKYDISRKLPEVHVSVRPKWWGRRRHYQDYYYYFIII